MSKPLEVLQAELNKQTTGLAHHMADEFPSAHLIMLIREMDVRWTFSEQFEKGEPEEGLSDLKAIRAGWQQLLRFAYEKLTMKPEPMYFAYEPWHSQRMMQLVGCSGNFAHAQRLVDMGWQGLAAIEQVNDTDFTLNLLGNEYNIEAFDAVDFAATKAIIAEIQTSEVEELEKRRPVIEKVIGETVQNPDGKFMSYDTTPEIDEYFEEYAQLHLEKMLLSDDFGEDDKFGGLPYGTYVDVLKSIVAVALRHVAFSIACQNKNPYANIATFLSYYTQDSSFEEAFLQRFGINASQMQQIIACLTLTKANFQGYTSITYAAPPPYVRMTNVHTIRSINGCLNNPFQFLNYELKRRWPKDYFKAVNGREDRFREDIFSLFPDDRIAKINREINIKWGGEKTDIDCVLYDKETATLGLFQLKWQEPFAHSLKRRRNNAGEFYKANKWVDRICAWVAATEEAQLLNALQIDKQIPGAKGVCKVRIFVLGRYAAHYTNGEPDARAVWGSWWQLFANMNNVEAAQDDLINVAADLLEFTSPANRIKRNEVPKSIIQTALVGPYRIRQSQNEA